LDLFLEDSRTFLNCELKLDNANTTNILVFLKPETRPRTIDLLKRLIQTITSFEQDILSTQAQGLNSHHLAIERLTNQTETLGESSNPGGPSEPISTVPDAQWQRTRNNSESLLKACTLANIDCKKYLDEWREVVKMGDRGESRLLSSNSRKRLARVADSRMLVIDIKLANRNAARLNLG
jgi:hypothetical protein